MKKNRFCYPNLVVKAVFKVEILTNFNFYVYFLAALGLSDVRRRDPDHGFCI